MIPRWKQACRAGLGCVVLFAATLAQAADPAADGVGYPSVEAAFRALKADPAATVKVEGDWVVFTQGEGSAQRTVWRFTRPGHPAHPSVVRRSEDTAQGEVMTAVLCQSIDTQACAGLQR